MVNNILGTVLRAKSVLGDDVAVYVVAPYTEADIPYDKVLRTAAVHFVVRNDNTRSRRRLSGDGVVFAVDTQVFDQPYFACHRKAHRKRFVRELLHRPAQRTFRCAVGIVRKGRYIDHFASSAAGGVFAEAFRARECGQLRKGRY